MNQPLSKHPMQLVPNCPVCHQAIRKALFKIKESAVYECLGCGLRYLDPCLSSVEMESAYESDESLKNFHPFHEGYYNYGDLETRSRTLMDFERGLDLLEKEPGRTADRAILDVGFGNGMFLALAKKRRWRVEGIDTSSKNLEMARTKFALELRRGTLEDLQGKKGSYDAISFWDVLEHTPEPHDTLRKASLMLKPGGLILIAVPNDRSFLAGMAAFLFRASFGALKKGIEAIYLIEHVTYFNLDTLTLLLQNNGFERRSHFFTSTDLDKYNLPVWDKFIAQCVLCAGKITGSENRLVAVFRKKSGL